jgi:hypothetical protein
MRNTASSEIEMATVISMFAVIGQTVLNWPAFASQYNFFHMCLAHA